MNATKQADWSIGVSEKRGKPYGKLKVNPIKNEGK